MVTVSLLSFELLMENTVDDNEISGFLPCLATLHATLGGFESRIFITDGNDLAGSLLTGPGYHACHAR